MVCTLKGGVEQLQSFLKVILYVFQNRSRKSVRCRRIVNKQSLINLYQRRTQNLVKRLRQSFLRKQLTALSCYRFLQKVPSQICGRFWMNICISPREFPVSWITSGKILTQILKLLISFGILYYFSQSILFHASFVYI